MNKISFVVLAMSVFISSLSAHGETYDERSARQGREVRALCAPFINKYYAIQKTYRAHCRGHKNTPYCKNLVEEYNDVGLQWDTCLEDYYNNAN